MEKFNGNNGELVISRDIIKKGLNNNRSTSLMLNDAIFIKRSEDISNDLYLEKASNYILLLRTLGFKGKINLVCDSLYDISVSEIMSIRDVLGDFSINSTFSIDVIDRLKELANKAALESKDGSVNELIKRCAENAKDEEYKLHELFQKKRNKENARNIAFYIEQILEYVNGHIEDGRESIVQNATALLDFEEFMQKLLVNSKSIDGSTSVIKRFVEIIVDTVIEQAGCSPEYVYYNLCSEGFRNYDLSSALESCFYNNSMPKDRDFVSSELDKYYYDYSSARLYAQSNLFEEILRFAGCTAITIGNNCYVYDPDSLRYAGFNVYKTCKDMWRANVKNDQFVSREPNCFYYDDVLQFLNRKSWSLMYSRFMTTDFLDYSAAISASLNDGKVDPVDASNYYCLVRSHCNELINILYSFPLDILSEIDVDEKMSPLCDAMKHKTLSEKNIADLCRLIVKANKVVSKVGKKGRSLSLPNDNES